MTQERTPHVHEDEVHDHDRGLSFDLSTLMTRRRALQLAAVGGLAAVVGCGGSVVRGRLDDRRERRRPRGVDDDRGGGRRPPRSPRRPPARSPPTARTGSNVLTESGIVRSDITSSFGSASGTAAGVPLADRAHDPRRRGRRARRSKGAAVYLWHCDREGRYSLYTSAVAERELPARRAGVGRRRQASPSPASARRLLRAAGPTSTSRSTRASTRPPRPAPSWSPPRSPCPRTPAGWSTPPPATSRASRTWPRPRWPPTRCSADGYSTQLGTVSGSVAARA